MLQIMCPRTSPYACTRLKYPNSKFHFEWLDRFLPLEKPLLARRKQRVQLDHHSILRPNLLDHLVGLGSRRKESLLMSMKVRAVLNRTVMKDAERSVWVLGWGR